MPFGTLARRLASLVIAASCAAACSSGSSGSGTSGTFLDEIVTGLRYEGPTFSGRTTAQGRFQYVPGDSVCFFLGIIPFGCGEARGLVSPIDLFPNSDTNDPRVLNVVRFLLSLDVDGDPSNGIDIGHVTTVAADAGIDFDQTTVDFGNDPDVLAFIAAQGHDGTLAGTIAASIHIKSSLADSFYFEQELYGRWMYTRYMAEMSDQASIVTIDEQEIVATNGNVTEEGDVAFDTAGTMAGERCFHDGGFEGDDLVVGFVDCFVPGAVMAAGLEIFDFFRMDRLDPGAVYESSDLFNDWFVASAFSQELLSLDEGNVGDFAATISSTGAVHFETVEDLEVEGEDCAYDGQMNVAGDFVSGTVDCTTSGSTAFSMESDVVN